MSSKVTDWKIVLLFIPADLTCSCSPDVRFLVSNLTTKKKYKKSCLPFNAVLLKKVLFLCITGYGKHSNHSAGSGCCPKDPAEAGVILVFQITLTSTNRTVRKSYSITVCYYAGDVSSCIAV